MYVCMYVCVYVCMYVCMYMLMEVTNFSDPVVSHLFSIFVKYFMNALWKMAFRSAVAQECHARFFMGSTYDL